MLAREPTVVLIYAYAPEYALHDKAGKQPSKPLYLPAYSQLVANLSVSRHRTGGDDIMRLTSDE